MATNSNTTDMIDSRLLWIILFHQRGGRKLLTRVIPSIVPEIKAKAKGKV
ncbi:hypothetical protein [Labilibaculum antarcticum]|nr:hypothetical protein [Labilibaculum antarcticum]